MALRFLIVFLVVDLAFALAVAADSASFDEAEWDPDHITDHKATTTQTCNGHGLDSDCVDEFEDDGEEMAMDSDGSRRILARKKKYISYGALKANAIPCNRRGYSYYNCNSRQRANPYTRGCSIITHCARHLD